MNLRKVFLTITLCFSSSNLIYCMEGDEYRMDDEIPCSGIPRANLPEEIIEEEESDTATHEDVQLEATSFESRIKREISNFNLIALGYLLESDEAATITTEQRQNLYSYALNREAEISQLLEDGHCISGAASNIDRIISYLYAFKFLENFKFPKVLFTNQPYHHKQRAEVGPKTSLNLALDTLIKNEQEGILICCFHIDDYDFAESLSLKNRANVKVEIVTNQSQNKNLHAIKLLIENGIPVSCPNLHRYEMNHHKFIIFKRNILNKCLVWHGSYNPTVYSNASSWEDTTIDDNPIVIHDFMLRFQEIKAASTPMTIEMVNNTH